jgi:hypothetical protein
MHEAEELQIANIIKSKKVKSMSVSENIKNPTAITANSECSSSKGLRGNSLSTCK